MREKHLFSQRPSGWLNSSTVCALSDSDRHLGHVMLAKGRWSAFDATHLNEKRTGFKYLGAFDTVAEAKAAVEDSVAPEIGISYCA